MPNPLVRLGPPVQSKNKVDRPRPTMPVMDDPAGDNHPYRGTESHGVADTVRPHDPDTYGVDGDHPDGIPVALEVQPEKEPAPVPVRVVEEYRRERHYFSSDRIRLDFTTANNPANRAVQLVGRDDNRVALHIINYDDNLAMLIGSTREETLMRGFVLAPLATITLRTEEPVYVIAVNATDLAFPNDFGRISYVAEYVVRTD